MAARYAQYLGPHNRNRLVAVKAGEVSMISVTKYEITAAGETEGGRGDNRARSAKR